MRPGKKPYARPPYAPMRQTSESPTSPEYGRLATSVPSRYTRAVAPSYVAATCCHVPGVTIFFETR